MGKILEVSNMFKRFGGIVATNDLSFDVEEGESLGLIGPNGAGKTTIFSLIMGEHKQNSGSIRLYGSDISNLSTHERINRGVSRTYQIPQPFPEMNVRENIRIGLMPNSIRAMIFRSSDLEREAELADSVGLNADDLERLPSELSMGDLRKLELARTLATDPKVVLLDEVFAGLTVGEIAQITELLAQKRKEGLTFVIVSHDLRSLEPLIDRAVAMTYGSKVAEGTFNEVMDDDGFKAAYLGQEGI